MKLVLIALVVSCYVAMSIAGECGAKIKEFHKCVGEAEKKQREAGKAKWEALKPKFDACYTDNGCTPPARGNHTHGKGHGKGGASSGSGEKGGASSGSGEKGGASRTSGEKGGASSSGGASGQKGDASSASSERRYNNTECRKALFVELKKSFKECLSKQGVNVSEHGHHNASGHIQGKWRFGGHRRFNHKKQNKALEGCAKKEQVRACKRALFNSSKPSDEERKAQFEERCKAKQGCKAALGDECLAQLQKFKKAACECRKEERGQFEKIRGSVKACEGVQQKKHGEHKGKGRGDESCEHKDYCKLGYDAFKQDLKARWAGKNETQH